MRLQSMHALLLSLTLVGGWQQAWAHAEHGTGEPVPQISTATRLPKGVDLAIVKTTAHQFSLSSDGRQTIEVLGEDGTSFIRIQNQTVQANVNAPAWFRAQQPGGGPVPARLKSADPAKTVLPDWKTVSQQSGFGWYDARLIDENLKSFKLSLRINGSSHDVVVQRKPAAAFTGYWTSRLTREPQSGGLSAMIPGLSTGAISLTRDAGLTDALELLDAAGKPFIRATPDAYWVDVSHPWFKDLGLFVNRESPQTRAGWSSDWVKVSDSRMLTYQDPRLKAPGGNTRAARTWSIPVRAMQGGSRTQFDGQMQWQSTVNTVRSE